MQMSRKAGLAKKIAHTLMAMSIVYSSGINIVVNEVYAYVAPKLFGGADAKSPVAGIGVDYPDDAYCLVSQRVQQVGEDILIAGELKNKVLQ